MRSLLTFLSLLLCLGATPIPRPVVVPTLVDVPDGRALARLFKGLAALEAGRGGRIRISFFGDSHVTPDVFTGRLRWRLQSRFGSAGPGFVLLGNPWRSYCHRQVKEGCSPGWRSERLWGRYSASRPRPRDSLFGVAGISVHSTTAGTAGAWVAMSRRPSPRNAAFSGADLYYLTQPGGGEVAVRSGEKLLGRAATGGEAKVPGFLKLTLPAGTRRLDFSAHSGEVRLFGVDLKVAPSGVILDTLGINGARAANLLEIDVTLLGAHLKRLSPDLVVLAYGSNEVDSRGLTRAKYAATLDKLLRRLGLLSPGSACLLVGPPDRGRKIKRQVVITPENLTFIVEEQRRLAVRHGCAFWDQRRAMGGPGAAMRWARARPPLVRKDMVHLSAGGYRKLADNLFNALIQAYGRWKMGQEEESPEQKVLEGITP